MKPILTITADSFNKYGYVLNFSDGFSGAFEVIVKEPSNPWRLATFAPLTREITFLEHHPHSYESFQPISGASLIIVAPNCTPEDYEVFLLDKPVCLFKGIWHNNLALSEQVRILVTENLDVECVFHYFKSGIVPGVE